MGSAIGCCAVEVAAGVAEQRATTAAAIGATFEVVEHGEGPCTAAGGRRKFIDRAEGIVARGDTIKISRIVDDEGARMTAVGAVGELVKNGFGPASLAVGAEFIDGANAGRAAVIGGAIEIAGVIKNDAGGWVRAVGARSERQSLKEIDRRLGPFSFDLLHLEDGPGKMRPAFKGGAIDDVALLRRGVKDGRRFGSGAIVVSTHKTVANCFLPLSARLGYELKHQAFIILAAGSRHAK